MCDDAEGACPIWEEKTPRARKQHECMACREAIAPGQKYHRTDSMYDGHWSHWVHCTRCWSMFRAIDKRARAEGEYLAIDPHLDCGERWEDPPDEVAALAFAIPSDFSSADGPR